MTKYRFKELVRNCLSKGGPTLSIRFVGDRCVVHLSGIWMDGGSQDKVVYTAKAWNISEQRRQAEARMSVLRKWMKEVPASWFE